MRLAFSFSSGAISAGHLARLYVGRAGAATGQRRTTDLFRNSRAADIQVESKVSVSGRARIYGLYDTARCDWRDWPWISRATGLNSPMSDGPLVREDLREASHVDRISVA